MSPYDPSWDRYNIHKIILIFGEVITLKQQKLCHLRSGFEYKNIVIKYDWEF